MLIDVNAHHGHLPEYSLDITQAGLVETTRAAGIDRVLASDLGAAFTQGAQPSGFVRIYPTYQSVDIHAVFAEAAAAGSVVQAFLRLRDPRVLKQVVPSSAAINELAASANENPGLRLLISGANLAEMRSNRDFLARSNVWLDIAHLQHPLHSLPKAIELLGAHKLLFGSNAPIFYPTAAVFRLEHSQITDRDRELISSANALQLFPPEVLS
jgi:hypothetical protein